MKRILLILLVVIIALGALAGAGFAGFRLGYERGIAIQGDAEPRFDPFDPNERPFDLKEFPGPRFRLDDRAFGPGNFARLDRDRGFGSPISFLVQIAILGIIVWAVYMLFKGNGWQLTFARMPTQTPRVESVEETPADAEQSNRGKQ